MTPAPRAPQEPNAPETPGAQVLAAALGVLAGRAGPLPTVTVTWARSAAGAIAAADGRPLALSAAQSMTLTHQLRAAHDAILVGIATVIADDPLLSVRLLPGVPPQPQPVVLDSRLRLPLHTRLLARTDRKPWIFFSQEPGPALAALEQRGARLFRAAPGPGGVDLYDVLRILGGQGIRSVMVEGGARVLRAFLAAGFADQVIVTTSPSTAQGLNGPDLPAFVKMLSLQVGPDAVTWGMPNP
jgi:riboflavin-specific deaminase-like protein